MLQMVQLFKCEEDSLQVLKNMKKIHREKAVSLIHVCVCVGGTVARGVVGRSAEDSHQIG